MPTPIDIDFEVFKTLTALRMHESETYNDVLRKLLKLKPQSSPEPETLADPPEDLVCKGVHFPVGTQFRANYKGQLQTGVVEKGAIVVNGQRASSLSRAAFVVTGNAVNGWSFWEVLLPGSSKWRLAKSLR